MHKHNPYKKRKTIRKKKNQWHPLVHTYWIIHPLTLPMQLAPYLLWILGWHRANWLAKWSPATTPGPAASSPPCLLAVTEVSHWVQPSWELTGCVFIITQTDGDQDCCWCSRRWWWRGSFLLVSFHCNSFFWFLLHFQASYFLSCLKLLLANILYMHCTSHHFFTRFFELIDNNTLCLCIVW